MKTKVFKVKCPQETVWIAKILVGQDENDFHSWETIGRFHTKKAALEALKDLTK